MPQVFSETKSKAGTILVMVDFTKVEDSISHALTARGQISIVSMLFDKGFHVQFVC